VDLHCRATHGPSGSVLITDAPVDNGGKGALFSPTDLVAAGLGTCVLTVMALVARRRSIDLAGTRVHVTREMASAPVRRIGRLSVSVRFPAGIAADERAVLERTAHTCPVHQSLHPDVAVEIAFIYPD
jgi:putative redox protein